VLKEILTEKSIDKLAGEAQNYMWTGWTGEHYVNTLRMLFRNGLMVFGKELGWRRMINPSYLDYNEAHYYARRIDFSPYTEDQTLYSFQRKIKAFVKWPIVPLAYRLPGPSCP
jgi:hypothetical protein